MSFPRYERYKDSGVEWLGEVPEGWENWKISHAFGSIGSGTTPPSDASVWYDDGTVPWVTTGELREKVIFETGKAVTIAAVERFSALRLHPVGSLAVAMYGATIGRLGILGVEATTNQACCVLSYPRHLDVHFVFYWLLGFKQNIIDLYATGGGQPNINQDIIASFRIPAPTLPEQHTIAAFLDRETGKIDELVSEQERLIALLKEKRQATISHAVTKGLNPAAPMKDSGIEWLGEVPVGWEVCSVKRRTLLITDGAHISPETENGVFCFVSTKDIGIDGTIDIENCLRTSKVSFEYLVKNGCKPLVGDVLFSKDGTIGRTVVVRQDLDFVVASSLMHSQELRLNITY